MREIKFRAWDKEEKKMFFGKFGERPPTYCEQLYLTLDGDLCESHRGVLDDPVEDMVPMQYTGLKDKNGKEIYEGDIIKHPIYSKNLSVIWHDGKYVSMFVASSDGKHGIETIPITACKVIGNIYENPELLKDKK